MRKFKTGAYVWYNGTVWVISECSLRAPADTEPYEIRILRYSPSNVVLADWCTPDAVQLLLTRDDLDRLALQVHEATTCQS